MRIGQKIENAYLKNLEMITMADFNIDVLNEPRFSKHKLIKTLKSLGLAQSVDFITRPVLKTGLDHVWLSHPDRIQNNIFSRDIGLSDHLPVFVIQRLKNQNKKSTSNDHSSIEYRNFKHLNNLHLLKI